MKALPFPFPLPQEEILRRRTRVLMALLAMDDGFTSVPVASVSGATLDRMLDLYDELFLQGYLQRTYGEIDVTLSSRLTSSAGKFIYTKSVFNRLKSAEIRMSSDFLARLDKGPFDLNGLCVATPQEAFMVVFEHELCHALEAALYGQTGHSSRFLALANGLFGHTATRHSLPTRRQEAARDGLFVGSRVSFAYRDQTLTGVVTYIGKTATVMVPARLGAYRDRRGRRYDKYRVTLEELKNGRSPAISSEDIS